MQTRLISLPHRLGLLALAGGLILAGARARGADAAAAMDTFPSFESYIKVSGYAPWMAGDKAASDVHTYSPSAGTFGIEDLLLNKDLNDDTSLTFKGKALDGSDDYLAQLDVSKANFGSVEAGYKRFRIFYDGVGGFFPTDNFFLKMSPEDLHVDRSAFWTTLTLARPNAPVFTLTYRNEIRTGDKASSEWGMMINPTAVVAAGAVVGQPIPATNEALVPNLQALAEHHQIIEASMTAQIGKTEETLRANLDWVDNVDTRYYTRYTGSTVTAEPPENVLDDQERVHTRNFRITNQTETPLGSKLSLETGLTFFHLQGTDGGQWITPSYSTSALVVFPTATAGNVYAAPTSDDYVGNVMLAYTPTPAWRAEAGFRQEFNVIGDQGSFYTTSLASTAKTISPTNVTTATDLTYSHSTDHASSPEVSLQYTGFENLTLFANFDDRIDRGNQHWINPYAATSVSGTGVVTTAPASIGSVFFQGADQDYEDAKLGANWNPSPWATVRVELFRKDHLNRFIGANDIVGTGSYGALFATGYQLNGARATLILRPLPVLTLTTTYLPQAGNMTVTSNGVTGLAGPNGAAGESPSGRIRTQSVNETVDWTPIKQFYAQASASVVYNYIKTAYPDVVVSTTSYVPVPFHNSNNNYVSTSALAGFVLSHSDNVELRGDWQQADNYNRWIANGGVPYGATYLMESVTAGLKHKFSDRLLGEAKAGYLRSTDGTTNGLTNYHGPIAYASITYAL